MKYLALALLASTAAAQRFMFWAETSNDEYNGKGLYANKEAHSGIDYIFVSDRAIGLEYDERDQELEGWDLEMAIIGNSLVMASRGDYDDDTAIVDGYLSLRTKTWVCKVTQDPNGYQRDNLVYVTDGPPQDDCSEVRFRAERDGTGGPSSSSSPSTTHPTSSLPTSDHTFTVPTISHPTGWNTTITTTTLTDITTYCPTETTITITTCGPQTCNPTTITVSEPTTVTVSSCIPPTSPPPPGTTTPGPSSVLPTSHLPTVSSINIGGTAGASFLAGIAGLVAMLA